MLHFEFRFVELNGRCYASLPKLNVAQTDALLNRLREEGYVIAGDPRPVAKGKGGTIHVDPAGLCWSTVDPSDAIGPLIPTLLRMPKETASLETLRELYFSVSKLRTSTIVKFSTRIESGSLWDGLRAVGESGLTPDEQMVASYVIGASSGSCRLLTDFPTKGSKVMILGKRQYYESSLPTAEAASTLRSTARKGVRNSYLPSSGILTLDSVKLPSENAQADLFDQLGEWCYLGP